MGESRKTKRLPRTNSPDFWEYYVQGGGPNWPCINMWETHGLGGDTHFRNLLGSWSPEKGRERASLPSTLGGRLHINGKGQIGAATVTQVPTSVEVSFNPLLLPLPTYCCFENGTHHQSLSLEGVCNVTTLLAKTRLIRVPGP